MNPQLSILDPGPRKFYEVTSHGITFRPATPQGVWLETVKQISGMFEGAEMTRQKALMMLADCLNYGTDEYGEQFAQSIEGMRQALGLTPKTIANAQWVYGKIESSRRRDGLTLGHYSVIAAIKDADAQDKFIEQVISDPEHTLTVQELKEEVAEKFPKTKRGKDRKKKAAATPDFSDTEETALQKLIDVSHFYETPDLLPKEAKEPLGKLYRLFRRKWMTGRKK